MAESSRLYNQTVPRKQMKARVKSTGEIIDIRVDMDYHGNTTWVDIKTNTEYYPSELEFIPDEKEQQSLSQRVLSQFSNDELWSELIRRLNETVRNGGKMRCRDCKLCRITRFKHVDAPKPCEMLEINTSYYEQTNNHHH